MSSRSILLVDDDRDATEIMRHLLLRAGFKGALRIASDPHEALQFIDEASRGAAAPDIVVVDLSLPAMHGFEVVRGLRSRLPQAFIAVVSGSDNAEDVHAAFSVGADAYLEKFPSVALLTELREALARGIPLPSHLRIAVRNRGFDGVSPPSP